MPTGASYEWKVIIGYYRTDMKFIDDSPMSSDKSTIFGLYDHVDNYLRFHAYTNTNFKVNKRVFSVMYRNVHRCNSTIEKAAI